MTRFQRPRDIGTFNFYYDQKVNRNLKEIRFQKTLSQPILSCLFLFQASRFIIKAGKAGKRSS